MRCRCVVCGDGYDVDKTRPKVAVCQRCIVSKLIPTYVITYGAGEIVKRMRESDGMCYDETE